MNRLRTLAIVAAPAALVIGLAIPAPAATAPKAPTTPNASCYMPRADQVLTAQEGIKLANACKAKKSDPSWHWMGNYGSVYDVVNVANSRGVGPGGLVTIPNASGGGLIPTFMYY
ncbi:MULTISPECIES: hypothetical protein [unclassified Streptomyces]|uniref:hypothetical protein n=1 Tax=unclassified Streptomyces TaxID=2593676 RepID=UPI0011A6E758|nr:hypothetical protein [Streptomyces sp. BK340]TVZ75584.1 hypothetical protein FB157_15316 [Streptomyces sp. BK340]